MLPSEDADEEKQCGNDPGDGHHPDDAMLRPPTSVFRCDFHGAKSIDGNQEDGVLGYEAHGVVHREPKIAQ